MRVVQIVPTLAYGDAIGNDALALRKALQEAKYDTDIYAETVVKPLSPLEAKSMERLSELTERDIAILHLSTGAKANRIFADLPCKKIVRYHNVTPPEYYKNHDPYIEQINKWALKDVDYLADKIDYCLADSEFNKADLIDMGYCCKIDVLPILIPFEDYKKEPGKDILRQYKDIPLVLFTGRIVPNKKIEDVIASFWMYKKYYNSDAVLVLVGSYQADGKYYQTLQTYIQKNEISDVMFTGHVPFEDILAYYQMADIFLCQSEHEGFCVPLVEAMWFQVPIVAYSSSAIPGTLGGSGIALDIKDSLITAGVMDRIYKNAVLRQKVLKNESLRLQDFSYDNIKKEFLYLLERFIVNGKQYEENSNY